VRLGPHVLRVETAAEAAMAVAAAVHARLGLA
jgi:16S rRNA U1498 N3-methylase RsmE